MSYKRGEIYYVERSTNGQTVGSEQIAGRPAIIVSNEKNNEFSPTLEVVYLTTKLKTNLPTHVDIRSAKKNSIALCEQVNTISTQRIGDYIGTCSDYEMQLIDAALMISLSLEFTEQEKYVNASEGPESETDHVNNAIIRVETERNVYKKLYEELLEKVAKQ